MRNGKLTIRRDMLQTRPFENQFARLDIQFYFVREETMKILIGE